MDAQTSYGGVHKMKSRSELTQTTKERVEPMKNNNTTKVNKAQFDTEIANHLSAFYAAFPEYAMMPTLAHPAELELPPLIESPPPLERYTMPGSSNASQCFADSGTQVDIESNMSNESLTSVRHPTQTCITTGPSSTNSNRAGSRHIVDWDALDYEQSCSQLLSLVDPRNTSGLLHPAMQLTMPEYADPRDPSRNQSWNPYFVNAW